MRRIEELALVKYRDGLWKRRVVEYWLWCDEPTAEVCKILKISRPLLQQWHRWHLRTRFSQLRKRHNCWYERKIIGFYDAERTLFY